MESGGESSHQVVHESLTDYEAQLYDRSIRLWGVDAQKRLRAAAVLLIGFRSLNAEICKNIVLAGINSVTLIDNNKTTPQDLCSHIFLSEESIGQKRAVAAVERVKELNPLVHVQYDDDGGDVSSKPESYFKQFQLVCASNCPLSTLVKLDKICRKLGVYFIAAEAFGFHAYFFTDLNEYRYFIKRDKDKDKDSEKEKEKEHSKGTDENGGGERSAKRMRYDQEPSKEKGKDGDSGTHDSELHVERFVGLEEAVATPWSVLSKGRRDAKVTNIYYAILVLYAFWEKHGRLPFAFSNNDATKEREKEEEALVEAERRRMVSEQKVSDDVLPPDFMLRISRLSRTEIAPVCAVAGGIAAQEIIKVISANDTPLCNVFFFDATTGSGIVERIPPASS
jgi:ubiquitin-like 1-activating enzyme E1 A